ncbi:cobalamin-dependent protein [Ilumatobacter nonamiensis]|uniref:cobalamin-dependent protein n=1 Tax=Ilumatobacter nonamiensis TaxID=467093 RepID=UPI00034D2347|nr:cobalamin-dependent protein [Ilumatobacter nonamiensis]
MDDDAEPTLELQSAADALGVHYQTAYRWVRNGQLPAQLTAGKYRISARDVAEMRASRQRPQAPKAPSPARLHRQSTHMHEVLLAGDEYAVRKIARSLVDEGTTILELVESVIAPPLRAIGEAWADGSVTISVEHRASAIVERVLGDLLPNPRGRRKGTVVVAAITGDLHSLPTTMAAVALREANWRVHHLGAHTPGEELLAFCASREEVDVAVISLTSPEVRTRAERAAVRIRKSGTPTLVGGAGRTLSDLLEEVQGAVDGRVGRREPQK